MEPSGKGSFQSVKLQRPGRTTVCSHSPRDIAAMVALNPILIIAVRRLSTCTLVNSPDGRTKWGARNHTLAAIFTPGLRSSITCLPF
jgi:hypothetical protein